MTSESPTRRFKDREQMTFSPRLLLTMGDVAGIGPEIIAKAWPHLQAVCRPVVVGDPGWMRQALRIVHSAAEVQVVREPEEARPLPTTVSCLAGTEQDLSPVPPGRVSAVAG